MGPGLAGGGRSWRPDRFGVVSTATTNGSPADAPHRRRRVGEPEAPGRICAGAETGDVGPTVARPVHVEREVDPLAAVAAEAAAEGHLLPGESVSERSLRSRASIPVEVSPVVLDELRRAGLYTRPTEWREQRLWDVISEAPMSTEFAITRFFVPLLAAKAGRGEGWAVFCDCDFLWLADIAELLDSADATKALCCVQHRHEPFEALKMDGQAQTRYARKNWSSLMLFNLAHPAHQRLTLETLNGVPGRDLHRFCWLTDDEIGALPTDWNWLEGSTPWSWE